jgi:hypothetical protein
VFNKFVTFISTITTITVVTFCFSVTPALAKGVKVVRNCAAFNPATGLQTRRTPKLGVHNLVKYYRARNGTPMAVLIIWDQDEYRRGAIAIPMRCLQSNKQGVIQYP